MGEKDVAIKRVEKGIWMDAWKAIRCGSRIGKASRLALAIRGNFWTNKCCEET